MIVIKIIIGFTCFIIGIICLYFLIKNKEFKNIIKNKLK